jgi:PAS domain S-box-containing protein
MPLAIEDGFRLVAENVPEGIFISCGFTQPLLYANPFASQLSGYSQQELLRAGPADLIPPQLHESIRERMEVRLSGRLPQDTYESFLLRKDGRIIPVEVTGAHVTWQSQPAVLTMLRDISSHKEAAAKLEKRLRERTTEWEETARTLETKQRELTASKQSLDRMNRELVKTNTALSVLARNIDRRREELEKKIARIVSAKILPVVEEIREDRLPLKTLSKLDILTAFLGDLTSYASKGHEVISALSTTELRVALMIKNGFSSEQIARVLHTSPHTVKTHRRNIRKKLKIQNSEVNLMSYLKAKFGKESSPGQPTDLPPEDRLEQMFDQMHFL